MMSGSEDPDLRRAMELPSMSGIGYVEMCAHLGGGMTLNETIERTKTGTPRLARHQNAWFKAGDERIKWLEAGARAEEVVESLMPVRDDVGV